MAKAQGAQCSMCPLVGEPFVSFEGPRDATVVLVGEAPGAQEVIRKRPFIGPSGELLRRTLDGVGVGNVYITNACLCRPPANKITPEALACCRDRLIQELQSLPNMRILVLLGNSALHALFPEAGGITAERGKTRAHPSLPGVAITPTLHPAAILRRPTTFADFAKDMSAAVSPPDLELSVPIGPTDVMVATSVEQAVELLEEGASTGAMVVDLETSGFDRIEDKLLCAVFTWRKAQALIVPQDLLYTETMRAALKSLFAKPILWIGHNMKFDVEFLQAQLGVAPVIGFDTMLAHYALDERQGTHDLKTLAATMFGAPDWEGTIKSYLAHPKTDSYALLPRAVLYRYASFDGDYTWRLWRALAPQIEEDPGLSRVVNKILIPASRALAEIELYGVAVDQERRSDVSATVQTELYDLEADLARIVRKPGFNPNSPAQVGVVLFDDLHLPEIKGRSTAEAILVELVARYPHPFVDLLLKYRERSKIASTYISGLLQHLGKDGRVRTSYQLHGTVTGRLSSREPNLQNIPRGPEIRNLFKASDGMRIIEADYSQAELRCFAWYSQDPFLLSVYREGRDIHSEVAREMFGPDFTKEQRVAAKMVVFGLVYGRTAPALARDVRIPKLTPAQAVQYINRFFARMPEGVAWSKKIKTQALTTGQLETPLGRRRRFNLVVADNVSEVERQSVNFMCQSLASDLTLLSLIRVHDFFKRSPVFAGSARRPHILLTVHDCIVAEAMPEDVRYVEQAMQELMTDTPKRILGESVPFKVSIAVGERWGLLAEQEVAADESAGS